MEALLFLVGIVAGLILARLYRPAAPSAQALVAQTASRDDDSDGADASGTEASAAPAGDSAAQAGETPQERLFALVRRLDALDERIQRPQDLLALPEFHQGAELLADPALFDAEELIRHLTGSGYVLQSMVTKALPRRPDVALEPVLDQAGGFGGYPLHFLIEHLRTRADAGALPRLLRHAQPWWWDFAPVRQHLRDYLQWAEQFGPAPAAPALDDLEESAAGQLRDTLKRFDSPMLQPLIEQAERAVGRRRETRVLGAFGRVDAAPKPGVRVAHAALEQQLQRLHELLTGDAAASVLVTGEHGVGKTVLIDLLAQRLQAEGWLVFEASAAEVLSGQSYIGELEERVREMLAVLDRPRALWRAPEFFDLLAKGSHSRDPRGLLDLVLPAIERGRLRVIGEITPRQLAQLLVARPVIKHHFELLNLMPLEPAALAPLAAQWARLESERLGREVAGERTLAEAARMAAQYFPEQHEPGRLLRLLGDALQAACAQEPAALPLDGERLLATIAQRSGLPLEVIDDRQSLDLERLREFFRRRVLGQDEAVDALLDRIAMLKAGLTDNGRPIGVFLFAGPTGTGKTELAKALGELLFGSDERLLRLDMSEFQSEDSAWRLTADEGGAGGVRSLTSRIREQPFSVVLLDEFEKAHPKVWDLFLQVFDDARLSDRSGHTADFRHSIIILTSNVGSTISRSAGPGFTSVRGGYSRSAVEKALFETFRREFINRLDRVVLFNPLDRALMREILHKELARVLTRRGLRNRDWAVEWEPSAIEFLLDRGFTPDLGARPLRRAIEHYLLAPLARSIVEHRAPQGDQFLFVRSAGDKLDVEFIDPNPAAGALAAPAPAPQPADGAAAPATDDLRDLVYAPVSGSEAVARLDARLAALEDIVLGAHWRGEREADYARMAAAGFWESPDRHAALDRIERRDRIESALDTALRLQQRLGRDGGNARFVQSLAQLLFLLGLAVDALRGERPQDALVEIDLSESAQPRQGQDLRAWWRQVLDMYLAWAQRRNMRVQVLREDRERGSAWLAVSGFGALELLQHEAGLHVYEDKADDQTQRLSVLVQVAPDLPGRARQAQGAPASAGGESERRIARRYRQSPAPLVRDGVRGWRSGRLDRVLAGEFDAISGE
ncbi:AAA family ATPase [Lysobacter enzymogenes]|uniref:AAA family ATPase n=1 Tax=Lysobacter enzymogenes TaxID=69 RepID=UPI00099BF889|nr:AAA family ATPase [Lysobacter enzymogenes]UZW62628.1 AAA family ATPase [Lysobacter enzymogenes]